MRTRLWYAVLPAFFLALNTYAETADLEKKIIISADKVESRKDSEGQKELFATGHAKLTKGSLIITGETIDLTYTDKKGLHAQATVYSSGEGATMRQKRKGTDRWVEGQSRSIYLNLLDDYAIVALHGNSRMRQIAGGKTVDESYGGGISYDMHTDRVEVFAPASPPANAMEAIDAQTIVCSDEKYHEVRNIGSLEPQIAKIMEGVTDRDGEFNAGDVGEPGTRFALAAATKDVVLVAVERGGRAYSVYLWFFIKQGGTWTRGRDFSFASVPPKSIEELLHETYAHFGCKNVPSIAKASK